MFGNDLPVVLPKDRASADWTINLTHVLGYWGSVRSSVKSRKGTEVKVVEVEHEFGISQGRKIGMDVLADIRVFYYEFKIV